MGAPMCRHLAKAGMQVTAWNRTSSKAAELAAAGVTVATSPVEAVQGKQHVILMVNDGPTCSALLAAGIYDVLEQGSSIIVMSSTDLASTREQATQCSQRGLRFVDAPVSGGEKGAQEANLSIMAGGSEEDFAAVCDILAVMGAPRLLGPAGSGQLTKLANQLIVALTIAAVAEGLLLAEAGGANLREVREALLGGFANSTIMQQHGLRMIENNFTPGGPACHHLKDLRGAQAAAAELGVKLEQLNWAEQAFAAFIDGGGGDTDHSGLITLLRARAHQ